MPTIVTTLLQITTVLLDVLGIEKAVFVGHDWGAILVWHHALLNPERIAGVANLSVPFRPREEADPVAFWEQMLGQDFYIVHFNRQPGVAATSFENNTRQFLTNMYRTKQWLETDENQPAGGSIISMAETAVERGELMMSEEELAGLYRSVQATAGFMRPATGIETSPVTGETTESVEQKVIHPSLMIYGEHGYGAHPQI